MAKFVSVLTMLFVAITQALSAGTTAADEGACLMQNTVIRQAHSDFDGSKTLTELSREDLLAEDEEDDMDEDTQDQMIRKDEEAEADALSQ